MIRMEIMKDEVDPAAVSKFTKYYTDPVYKAKHLTYVKSKVVCGCGMSVKRCNMTAHKKTKNHILKMDIATKEKMEKETTRMERIIRITKEFIELQKNVAILKL